MRLTLAFSIVLAVAALSWPMDARAQENVADREAAAAQQLMRDGDIAGACGRFELSRAALAEETPAPAIDRETAVRLALADCRERNRELAVAWLEFSAIEAMVQTSPSRTAKVRGKTAEKRRRALEPRLTWLTIKVGASLDGMVITRGDRDVPATDWNLALPLDPGDHVISVTAPGHSAWTTKVSLSAAGERQTVEVPALQAKAAAVPEKPVEPAKLPEVPEREEPAATDGGNRRWIALGVGVAALAAGGGAIGLELSARSSYDASAAEPDDARQDELYEAAVSKRYLAQGLAGAAVAGAGVAVWLWLSAPSSSSDSAAERTVRAAPVVSADHVGAALIGSF